MQIRIVVVQSLVSTYVHTEIAYTLRLAYEIGLAFVVFIWLHIGGAYHSLIFHHFVDMQSSFRRRIFTSVRPIYTCILITPHCIYYHALQCSEHSRWSFVGLLKQQNTKGFTTYPAFPMYLCSPHSLRTSCLEFTKTC